jgi:hypothetical protein
MRWARHVACTGDLKIRPILSEDLLGRYHLGAINVGGKIQLKHDVRIWTGFIWLRTGASSELLWPC